MDAILQDIRNALRLMRRRPAYAAAVLLTLVLGVGATTAVFSIVQGVLLEPLPHPDPEQLVLVWEVDQRPGTYDDHNRVSAAKGSRGTTTAWRQRRLRAAFVVGQLAFSLVLLISAGLMLRAFGRLQAADPGFDRGGLTTMKVSLPNDA